MELFFLSVSGSKVIIVSSFFFSELSAVYSSICLFIYFLQKIYLAVTKLSQSLAEFSEMIEEANSAQ